MGNGAKLSSCLLQFVGYTFGVMDTIAEWTHVYKIKTIGDAYLAIAGLPDYPRPNPTVDMMKFASYCAQIFSHRYKHPDAGSILSLIAVCPGHSLWREPCFVVWHTAGFTQPLIFFFLLQEHSGMPSGVAIHAAFPGIRFSSSSLPVMSATASPCGTIVALDTSDP